MAAAIARHPVARVSAGVGALMIAGAVAVAAFNSLEGPGRPRPLWPAKTPPVVGLCTEQLSYTPDGNVSPLFCPGDEINTLAWSYLAQEQLGVMALGPRASAAAVQAAVEQDLNKRAAAATECSAAVMAATYNGWTFHIKPTSGLTLDCPIQE